MATNCEYIEENLSHQKCTISNSASNASMTHEEKQDSTEKSCSKSSFSDASSEAGGSRSGSIGSLRHQNGCSTSLATSHFMVPSSLGDDVFENAFEASMDDLEHNANNDGYESDSEPSLNGDAEQELAPGDLHSCNSENMTCSTGLGTGTLHTFPRCTSFEYQSSGSDSDEDDVESSEIQSALNMSPQYYTHDIFHMRPYLMPFMERRRLSQCKEEDEDDGDKSPQPQSPDQLQAAKFERNARPTPPPPPPANDKASAEKFKDLERLRQQFMHKIDSINTNNVEDIKTVTVAPEHTSPPPPPPIPPTILPPALINLLESAKSTSSTLKPQKLEITEPSTPESPLEPISPTTALIIKGKFTVTKAQETPELQQLRGEAEKLKHLNASANAHTISFPSSFGGYSSVQGLFSQRYGSNKIQPTQPHLSKQFFDSSLVEIRSNGQSTSSLNNLNVSNNCDNSIVGGTVTTPVAASKKDREFPHLDDVWIKRGSGQASKTPPNFPVRSSGSQMGSQTSLPKKQYHTDDSAAESGRTTAVQSEDVS